MKIKACVFIQKCEVHNVKDMLQTRNFSRGKKKTVKPGKVFIDF